MPLAVGMALRATAGDWTSVFWAICALDAAGVAVACSLTAVEKVDDALLKKDRDK